MNTLKNDLGTPASEKQCSTGDLKKFTSLAAALLLGQTAFFIYSYRFSPSGISIEALGLAGFFVFGIMLCMQKISREIKEISESHASAIIGWGLSNLGILLSSLALFFWINFI